ncbi:MAG TPA: flagellar biosynthesis anti-sigma factor FlgM [Bacillales bacterium]
MMKINGVNHSNINPYKKPVGTEQTKQDARRKDQIEISPEAKQLQQKSRLTAERQEKVDQIKAKVDAGQYQVDADKVAKKFYEFWRGRQ